MADYPTDEFLETRLAANVKRLRQRLSISSDELAHATGLHLTVIEAIETGAHNSDLATLDALGRGLRIDPGELLAAR